LEISDKNSTFKKEPISCHGGSKPITINRFDTFFLNNTDSRIDKKDSTICIKPSKGMVQNSEGRI